MCHRMHDSQEQGNRGSSCRGIGRNAGDEEHHTDRSISFGVPKPKTDYVDGHELQVIT
jgi:hypothetical protein